MKILYAEDEKILREYMANEFNEMGHTVESVEDGEHALERLAASADYDLLLTDQNMHSGVTGVEVLKRVREDVKYKELPVIVLSSDDRVAAEVRKLGGAYMPKGTDFEQRVVMLRGCFDLIEFLR